MGSAILHLFVFSLLAFGLGSTVHAEYRVFMLRIEKPPTEPGQPPEVVTFPSNLDPEQYIGYYPVGPKDRITYIDTWRCRGRTDNKDYCPSPRAPAAVPPEGPESPAKP